MLAALSNAEVNVQRNEVYGLLLLLLQYWRSHWHAAASLSLSIPIPNWSPQLIRSMSGLSASQHLYLLQMIAWQRKEREGS